MDEPKIIKPQTIEELPNSELIAEAYGLYDQIYNVECFGTSDLLRLDRLINEAIRRGMRVFEQKRLEIELPEPDEADKAEKELAEKDLKIEL